MRQDEQNGPHYRSSHIGPLGHESGQDTYHLARIGLGVTVGV